MAVYVLAAIVNFDATIFDGNDLSVIRGSSLLALRFPSDLLQHLNTAFALTAEVKALYVGASEMVVRIGRMRAAVPQRVTIEAPFGSKPQWRDKLLPSLVDEVKGGATAEAVAGAWVANNRNRIKAKDSESKTRSIVRQINYRIAAEATRADAAALPDVDEAAVENVVETFRIQQGRAALRYFTPAHACYTPEKGDNLADILAVLFSRLRTQQLQQPTVALPDAETEPVSAGKAFCPFTLGRQPAMPGQVEKGQPISRSAKTRRDEGREQKSAFYWKQIERSADAAKELGERLQHVLATLQSQKFSFAEDFDEITKDGPRDLPPSVKGKLAVIFMDGNGFTAKRMRCAEVPGLDDAFAAYRRFCLALERTGGLILAELVPWMLERPEFRGGDDDEPYLRFETLLWGGDDICFVLPAWGAFVFMGKLQEILKDLRAPVGNRVEQLTYKAGMVFADDKSPIRDLRNVAYNLADLARPEKAEGERNIVQVMALEGLDRADLDPTQLRKELFGECGEDGGAFGLEGSQWAKICETFRKISEEVGRSQLHKWYVAAEDGCILKKQRNEEGVEPFLEKFESRLRELNVEEDLQKVLTGKKDLLARGAGTWPLLPLHHLLTLSDYVDAVPEQGQGRAAS